MPSNSKSGGVKVVGLVYMPSNSKSGGAICLQIVKAVGLYMPSDSKSGGAIYVFR